MMGMMSLTFDWKRERDVYREEDEIKNGSTFHDPFSPIDNTHQHSLCTVLPNDVYLLSTADDVVGIDPRAGSSPSFRLPHDRSRGIVTSMASLSRGNAVLTGSQRGWLHLFDLRFICRVGAFSHPIAGTGKTS
jgi:hypothetical protein